MFPFKEHEAENTFRGATHIGQAGPLTPYHHTVQPDNGSASRPRLIRRKPVDEALGKPILKDRLYRTPSDGGSLQ